METGDGERIRKGGHGENYLALVKEGFDYYWGILIF